MSIEDTVARIEELRIMEKEAKQCGKLRDLELIRDELHALERQLDWE